MEPPQKRLRVLHQIDITVDSLWCGVRALDAGLHDEMLDGLLRLVAAFADDKSALLPVQNNAQCVDALDAALIAAGFAESCPQPVLNIVARFTPYCMLVIMSLFVRPILV